MPIRIVVKRIVVKEIEEEPGLKSYDFVIIPDTMVEKIKLTETKINNLIKECKDIEVTLMQILEYIPSKIIQNGISCYNEDYYCVEELLKKVRTTTTTFSDSDN